MQRYFLYSLLWSFCGDGKWKIRETLGTFICCSTNVALPEQRDMDMIDFEEMLNFHYL